MSRMARAVVPGEPHHVIQRGNRRVAVFHAEQDHQAYLRLLREYSQLHGVSVWAYCLMTNHVHLVAVPKQEDSFALALRGAHTVYAMQYNTRYNTTGHLWQGRFKSCPMDFPHLWAAVRYVERNPVSAGMVAKAQDYRWSSAAAHCGLRKDPLLDPAFPPPGLVEDWADWLSTPEDEEKTKLIRQATNTGRPCGEKEYVQRIEQCLGRNLTPAPRGRRPKSIHPMQDEFFADGNGV